jgi:hypothetical protein
MFASRSRCAQRTKRSICLSILALAAALAAATAQAGGAQENTRAFSPGVLNSIAFSLTA